MDDLKISFNCK